MLKLQDEIKNDEIKEEIKEDTVDASSEEKVEAKEESQEETKKEKKNKYKEQIAKLEAEKAELKNEYLKALADAQNTKKRLQEEAIKDRKYASQKVVGELINPIDMLVQIVNMPAPSPAFHLQILADDRPRDIYKSPHQKNFLPSAVCRKNCRLSSDTSGHFSPPCHPAH